MTTSDEDRWVVESDGDGGYVLTQVGHCGRRHACPIFGVNRDGRFYRKPGTYESAPAGQIALLLRRAEVTGDAEEDPGACFLRKRIERLVSLYTSKGAVGLGDPLLELCKDLGALLQEYGRGLRHD